MAKALSFSAENFAPHVGAALSLPDGRQLKLMGIDHHIGAAAPRPGFTLLLRGAPAPIVPEGMHRLAFENGVSFELYLIPIHTRARDHQDYQIVFN